MTSIPTVKTAITSSDLTAYSRAVASLKMSPTQRMPTPVRITVVSRTASLRTDMNRRGIATVPILEHAHEGHGLHTIDVMQYANPLPHVLMLTAIVVMVATLGVALAVAIMIYRRYDTLEEDEIIRSMKKG